MKPSDIAALAHARYGQKIVSHLPKINPVLETLLLHRSVRRFLEAPLPPDTLEMLMIAAQSASSSSNLQMWSAVAVEDGARKARLADAAGQQNFIKQAPLFLIFLADMAMLADVAKGRQQALDGIDYLDTFLVAAFDAVLAAQNALIAAESMGLGAVFIGAIRNQPEKVIAELRLPEHVFPIVGLCVGVPDLTRETQIKPRLPLSTVLHQEQYDKKQHADGITVYDEIMRNFYSAYRNDGICWSEQALTRLHGPETLAGRDHLRDAILQQKIALK